MARIYVDNRPYEVDPRQNLLEACLSAGFDLPYFCWHPAMGSVGACRQCAVTQYRDENDTRGRIIMACMQAAADGTRIGIHEPVSGAFRKSIIEWLMINHPHDCPVCEEGGECHLQDMTVMTGHTYRRYRFAKRTFHNQYLGPFLNHEMNRCITCYRCVRFYGDYAGGRDLQAFASKNHVYFGRSEDGVLENEFSGNLAEVCPTGVFTDKPFSDRYTRKWDLRGTPSICQHCSLGCNINPNERYGELRRILNRYNHQVNGYFICDRGRYGYGFVNGARRVRQVLGRDGTQMVHAPLAEDVALERCATMLAGAKAIGIGSPRASLEANFALRQLVGADNFFSGLGISEQRRVSCILDILQSGPARAPSLHDVEQCDAVLVLGEDIMNTAPRLGLAIRQALRHGAWEITDKLRIARWNDTVVRNAAGDARSPLFVATPAATGLDAVAAHCVRAAPAHIARLGFAVANAIDDHAPAMPGLNGEHAALAHHMAQTLKQARRPLIVAGSGSGFEGIIEAAANVAWALCKGRTADLCYTLGETNALGMAMLGGGTLNEAFDRISQGNADTVVILENDLYRRAPSPQVDDFLGRCGRVIVLDHTHSSTTAKAHLLLPAASFAESDGTVVSNEGRAQRYFQLLSPQQPVAESWRWLQRIIAATRGRPPDWNGLDDVTRDCSAAFPALSLITDAAPPAAFRLAGTRVPREPPRYSGRTAMHADRTMHEPKPPDDPDAPLSFSMEGYPGQPPAPLIPYFWAPRWNSIQSVNKFQEKTGGPLRGGDAGVRLIEPPAGTRSPYYSPRPANGKPRRGEVQFVALYHLFGSEEMSMLSKPIAERAPNPYVALNPADAGRAQEGTELELRIGESCYRLPLRMDPGLPSGVAGLPMGLPMLAGLDLPAFGRVQVRP